jgi:hypothetical protein
MLGLAHSIRYRYQECGNEHALQIEIHSGYQIGILCVAHPVKLRTTVVLTTKIETLKITELKRASQKILKQILAVLSSGLD